VENFVWILHAFLRRTTHVVKTILSGKSNTLLGTQNQAMAGTEPK